MHVMEKVHSIKTEATDSELTKPDLRVKTRLLKTSLKASEMKTAVMIQLSRGHINVAESP